MSIQAGTEALRIVRRVEAHFPSEPSKTGSAFVVAEGKLLTCAHVILSESGVTANRVVVQNKKGHRFDATVGSVARHQDLARLEAPDDTAEAPIVSKELPEIGLNVIFAGQPQGIRRPAIFPGLVADSGKGLISQPRCEVIQVAGMINNGNSGGPLLDIPEGRVIGIVTAKYVPLLQEIDKLTRALEQIPQFPSDVGIGSIDFSKFVNLTISSMWQMGAVLRLVQVGTGWAVPAKFFEKVGI